MSLTQSITIINNSVNIHLEHTGKLHMRYGVHFVVVVWPALEMFECRWMELTALISHSLNHDLGTRC